MVFLGWLVGCFSRQGFSVALEPVLKITLVDQVGLELSEICLHYHCPAVNPFLLICVLSGGCDISTVRLCAVSVSCSDEMASPRLHLLYPLSLLGIPTLLYSALPEAQSRFFINQWQQNILTGYRGESLINGLQRKWHTGGVVLLEEAFTVGVVFQVSFVQASV